MTANLGAIDRRIRAGVAAVLLGLALLTQAWPLVVASAGVALTAMVAFCPLYRVYGLSTVDGLRKDCGPGGCATTCHARDRRP